MRFRPSLRLVPTLLTFAAFSAPNLSLGADDEPATTARKLLDESGVHGGLVVHLGCGDGKLTTALRRDDRYLVHGLDSDPANIDQARNLLREQRLTGHVSVETFPVNRLPYTANLVNLIVVEQTGDVADTELLRVLSPRGVALIRDGDGWRKLAKPWPDDIDEWTHFLHDPDNNAVSRDSVVGPPQHIQWISGPRWARGHEQLATMSIAVTTGGRMFYIADDGPTASVDLPAAWSLTARDAFNGKLLWKKPILKWESTHRPFRSGPTHLPRRLVAIGDVVYVTLGFGEPLVALDAATGDILKTYPETEGTEEVLVRDDTLFLVVGDVVDQEAADRAVRRGKQIPPVQKRIFALDAQSGELLWEKSGDDTADLYAQTLAVSGGNVILQNTRALICLDAASGTEKWRHERPSSTKRPAWSVPTVVIHNNVVISADREAPDHVADPDTPQDVDWEVSFQGGDSPKGEMIVFSIDSGKRLWSAECREGYNAPVDVLLTDDLIWSGDLVQARDPGITAARDPETGEIKRERPEDSVFFTPGMSHHRCYRNRATENYVLVGRSGVEMIDIKTGKAVANHWIRGTCQFGVLPANGLLYVPPHTCACYLKTKLNGLNALAPARPDEHTQPETPRLIQGPAYAIAAQSSPTEDQRNDWPTYRHDASRSGATATQVSADLEQAWQADIGGRLSSLTIADERVFVAEVDAHTIHALNSSDGQPLWTFTAGGRIDSPPTVHGNLVLFGSADGHVYCLSAADGSLAWRFRAGPEDRRILVDDQLESAWPVHGAVLVQNGIAYFAAGRSSFLDGGVFLIALDPQTGEVLSENVVSGRDSETGEQPQDAIDRFDMPGGLPDILSSDGEFVYMRDLKFDDQCRSCAGGGMHLFSPTGFLDETWWHRSYWLWGPEFQSGWPGWHQAGNTYPAGRLIVFNDETIYGFGRDFYPQGNAGQWATGEKYRLYAASKTLKDPEPQPEPREVRRGRKPYPQSRVQYRWSETIEPEARAMVLAGDTLFVAGPHGETHRSLPAFQGEQGISLQAISTTDGSPTATYKLDSLPVMDGMAAAHGRLYLSTKAGRITCFAQP